MNALAQYLDRTKTRQVVFAKQIERDQTLVSRLARGTVKPTLETAQKIEAATAGEVKIADWPHFGEILKAGGAA